jgi:putative ABC transport system ATP-binding protein
LISFKNAMSDIHHVVEINNLKVGFTRGRQRVEILNIPAWNVLAGTQVALYGPSGSGKTTLLHVLALLQPYDRGSVRVCETLVDGMSELTRDRFRADHIGYVFQNYNLLQGYSALENVLLGMTFGPRPASAATAESWLSEVGLAHRVNNYPAQLSFGEQQRVAVARALANHPSLLLADEPTASLDPDNRDEVLELLLDMSQRHGCALILVTHDETVIARFKQVLPFIELNQAVHVSQPSAK